MKKMVGLCLLSVCVALPMAASAKTVCLKTEDDTRFLKLSGFKNLKKPGSVAPLHGYLRTINSVAPLLSARQPVHGAAIGVGENKVRLSLTIDRRLGALTISLPDVNTPKPAELHTLVSASADVKTLEGTYQYYDSDVTSYAFVPVKCKEADLQF